MRRLSNIQERSAEETSLAATAPFHLERTIPGIAIDATKHLAKAVENGDSRAAMRSAANILSKLASLAKDAGHADVEEAIWKAVEAAERASGRPAESVDERVTPTLDQGVVAQYKKERAEIEKEYTVRDGRISSPGKFEGEMIYVPVLWNHGLDGMADEDDGNEYGFNITPEERAAFPELAKVKTVRLREREDGFVVEV